MWKATDPRIDINKRAFIVILRPSLLGGWTAGTAYVDTKEVYTICTSFKDYQVIGADENWDPDWKWAFGPA